ncbi:MAG: molybdenum cofactor guanylyltransferase [Solirubrobacteraceae bacterium]|nr:molybdenum cofactor guanylyltransferase [Solirubrobacteraceae bacterium]
MVGRRAIGAVLAGGEGRRIGGDKAIVELDGRPLLQYPVSAMRAAVGEVAVVAKRATALPHLEDDVPIWLEDDEPQHPLTGIVRALHGAEPRAVIVVAGDMPLLTRELLEALLRERARGAAAVVPFAAGRLQPLCARYEPAALAALADFDPGASVSEAVDALRPRILDWPDAEPFLNVNRPEDLLHASALLAVRPARSGLT